jgi:GNAT superfamily N-acetyltransferase
LLRFWRKPPTPDARNVRDFLAELQNQATKADGGHFVFHGPDGQRRGFVQFIIESPTRITIHRLWSREPGKGDGTNIMRALCDLADRFGVELTLKTIPIGRKPYPLDRDQLAKWYEKFGFERKGKWMRRTPPQNPKSEI